MVSDVVGDTDQVRTLKHRLLFARCANCGRYVAPEDRVQGRYCSAPCADRYLRCTNCGRYYLSVDAYSEEHCSRVCATRYSLQRSYGPAQIDIRMEELV
jgi:uncharacterized OB-fold protein